MRLRQALHRIAVLATVPFILLSCDNSATKNADEATARREALAQCDAQASHPHDPNRLAAGVSDEQMAPGLAIPACQSATKLNPDEPRAWFELGRSYWVVQRDKEAFAAFVKAAGHHYGAAEKYIGDAFLEGRGLPAGEQEDAHTALAWYQKAKNDGFLDGEKAAAEVEDELRNPHNDIFDASIFQNGAYMQRLYDGNFSDVEPRVFFLHYVRGVVDELGSDKILYVDSHCKPLVTKVGGIALDISQVLAYVDTVRSRDKGKILFAVGSLLAAPVADDQGRRDAVVLVNRYHCDSPVVEKITSNIVLSYNELMSEQGKGFSKLKNIEGGLGNEQGGNSNAGHTSAGDAPQDQASQAQGTQDQRAQDQQQSEAPR